MRNQSDIFVFGSTQIAVGTSTIIRISPSPFESYKRIGYLSGGSLEVVKAATLTGPGWGTGYLLQTTERIDIWGNAAVYLAASGATAIAQVIIGGTAGSTLV